MVFTQTNIKVSSIIQGWSRSSTRKISGPIGPENEVSMFEDQKRVLLAVVLTGVVIFSWQFFFAPKVPENKLVTSQQVVTTTPTSTSTLSASAMPVEPVNPVKPVEPEKVNFTNEITGKVASFKFNQNFSILDIKSNFSGLPIKDVAGTEIPIVLEKKTATGYIAIEFLPNETGSGVYHSVNDDATLSLRLDDSGRLNYTINFTQPTQVRFAFTSAKQSLENRQVRNFTFYSKELNTIEVGDDEDGEATVSWLGIDFNYHLLAYVLKKPQLFQYKTTEDSKMYMTSVNSVDTLEGFVVYTKKEYDHLIALGDNLHLSVDFGIWSILAVPILRVLQFFYKFLPNYGVSIILITLLLRLLTFPLQYKSIKSMNRMKEIQPELNKLKEKYKEDPQRLQKETMAFFKQTGYNPMSGCLPILLQIPIFFAFYRVLYNAVELVGAPFALWIADLSIKDPYYVLPVLMGASFFLQQKLTPSPTADQTQQKVMMFMPLLFVFIMKDLPAGLNLYIFVSTIAGVLQQVFMARKNKKVTA